MKSEDRGPAPPSARSADGSPGFLVEVPGRPQSLAGVRLDLLGWLTIVGVAGQLADDIVLVVNEACSNSIEHGYRSGTGTVRVCADVVGEEIHVEVTDDGSWRDAGLRPRGRGRGVPLMHAVSRRVELDGSPNGTTVTLTFDRS